METLTTAEAAEQAGITVRQWHYWTDKLGLEPARKLDGIRGAKLWNRAAVRRVAREVEVAA
jgi:DNA-binding transcriptional MerR regulator